jgi:hypothetical protein
MVLPGVAAATAVEIVPKQPEVPPGFTHKVAPLAGNIAAVKNAPSPNRRNLVLDVCVVFNRTLLFEKTWKHPAGMPGLDI